MHRLLLIYCICSALAFAQCRERVARVRELDALRQVMKECVAPELAQWIFIDEARLRAPLRALITDPEVGDRALGILALIGDPSDLEVMLHRLPNGQGITEDRWKYPLVAALIEPRSESEWEFLRKAAISDNDRWVDAGAILALQLNHSERSERILEEIAVKNPSRAGSAARALAFIHTNPPPFDGTSLDELASRVASVVARGEWEKIEAPIYNRARTKAIVPITWNSGWDRLTYTATFHRIGARWTLRGVRETFQQFAPPPFTSRITRPTVPLLDEPPPVIDPVKVP